MYKVTVYMVDDSFDSALGGQPTITYGKNMHRIYEFGSSVVGHMFYTVTDLMAIRQASVGWVEVRNPSQSMGYTIEYEKSAIFA